MCQAVTGQAGRNMCVVYEPAEGGGMNVGPKVDTNAIFFFFWERGRCAVFSCLSCFVSLVDFIYSAANICYEVL